jgi:hypothetical protein
MPDHAGADEIVMLPRLARVGQREIGSRRPEVANLEAKAQAAETIGKRIYIQSRSPLKHARSRGTSRIRAVIIETLVFAEPAKAATNAPQGEIAVAGNKLKRSPGVTNICL